MSILAGSYERFLFGYAVQGDGDELKRSFTHAAHKGVVKCIAAAGQFAATGGADDLIHLYDLKNDKDLGFLMSPGEGAVTALAFFTPAGGYAPTHLLSGSADGSMSVWSVGGGWECMKTMRGHRKEVYGIAVHPSGLLALSVSRDGCLRMWDLVKGRCTYTVRLEAEAEAVHFSGEAGGARYALLCGTLLTLHSVGEEGTLRVLAHPRRALCMAWAPGGRIVSGSEDGSLRLWDTQTGDELLCINRAHASRIRALALVPGSSGSSAGGSEAAEEEPLLVATASSDGSIKLWDLSKAAAAAPGSSGGACLAEAQTRARLTCLATADLPAVMQRRLQQAAAARQKAAAAAAAQQPKQQQQQEVEGGKKRKQQVAAAGGGTPSKQQAGRAADPQQQRPAKKLKQRGQQQGAAPPAQQQQQQQQPGKGKAAKAGKPGKAGGKPAAAAAPESGVVVHDGVVEFLDSPEQAKKAKKKQQQVAAKRRAAAQHGKRPAMPGKRFKAGGGGGGSKRK